MLVFLVIQNGTENWSKEVLADIMGKLMQKYIYIGAGTHRFFSDFSGCRSNCHIHSMPLLFHMFT